VICPEMLGLVPPGWFASDSMSRLLGLIRPHLRGFAAS